ncbi:MAG: hypothetical protein ACOC4C_05360 [Fibrobacterota bacterium]
MSLGKCFVVACVMIFAGCASNSNFRSGRPLGAGNAQGVFSVSHIGTREVDTAKYLFEPPDFTFFEIGAMLGVLEGLDVGLKYTFPSAGCLEAKYALVGKNAEKGFFLTPGLRGGYTSFPYSDSTEAEESNRIELAVPLYLSYYPLDWFGFNVIPTYSVRFFNSEDSEINNLLGGNINIDIGRKFGFIAEVAFYRNFTAEWNEFQFGGGIKFALRDLF